ncbi:MAG: hypothetical protein HY393_01950 [Candidatus Diapherotrites archaeon]|nr:hypothetical protein [Candidatus Diapherotrites archaeon]
MTEPVLALDELVKHIQGLHQSNKMPWNKRSRTALIQHLKENISELENVRVLLRELDSSLKTNPHVDATLIASHEGEAEQVMQVLKRNLAFEHQKLEQGFDPREKVDVPQLYEELEQRILGLALNIHTSIERVQVQLRRQGLNVSPGSKDHHFIKLLKSKEDELHHARKELEEWKRKSFFGRIAEPKSNDLEQELMDLERKLTGEKHAFETAIKGYRRQVEAFAQDYGVMEQAFKKMESLIETHSVKELDLLAELKKERDYAKKMLLEMQNELALLRNTYSKELIELEQNKLQARLEEREKWESRLIQLKRELQDQKEISGQLETIAREKDALIERLRSELAQKSAPAAKKSQNKQKQ